MVSSPEISGVEAPNESMTSSVAETTEAAVEAPAAYMSSAVADEPEVETFEPQVETFEPQVAEEGPKIAVDPMMAEGGSKSGGSVSFSEMTELPPLKEVYIAPPPPPVDPAPVSAAARDEVPGHGRKADEKPKVQPREVAQKAIKEIKGVPPKLMGYAIGGALALILVIGIGVTIYVHSLNSDDDTGTSRPAAVAETPAPDASQPAPKKEPAPVQPVEIQPVQSAQPQATEEEPAAPARAARNPRKKVAAAPVVIPGQLAIDSMPQGAQVQVDGRTDPSYVTPFALTNLQPGQHSHHGQQGGLLDRYAHRECDCRKPGDSVGPPDATDGDAGGEERSGGSQHLRGRPRRGRENTSAGQRG